MLISKQRSASNSVKIGLMTILSVATIVTSSLTLSIASELVTNAHSISLEEAQVYARISSTEEFEVTINSKVLSRLNQVVGSQRLRKKLRESLVRMQDYREMISTEFLAHDIPLEMVAVPIVESAYRNLGPENNPTTRAAGIWQFIKSTAKKYDLTVTNNVDDRLDPKKETVAARRLLHDGSVQFKDWKLSLLAYNIGAQNVREGIEDLKSNDPWKIEENAIGNDKDYLAKVMTAIIIMKNPDLVK